MAYNPYTGRWEMDGAQQVQMQPMPRAQVPQMPQQPPKLGVLTVASEASINNLQMQPNDNALALHETENLLYTSAPTAWRQRPLRGSGYSRSRRKRKRQRPNCKSN